MYMTLGRKRRGSLAHGRYGDGYIIIAEAPAVERVGRSRRAAATVSRSKLAPEVVDEVTRLGGSGRSLREIARTVHVSHETVRRILRDAKGAETVA